ncbi:hypothetical protein J437_LFUL013521 [Ladona fulva]|uniref:Peptide-N(4)-(N-acetyl-beta-glucosaminyl)asparagine amidase n=1 Tax=Ladona fulva TaxID=123851 RepID=A0A8K0NZU0_LADFU|nr:hypothetical protein J437_LFUL013521 [Ladona fulva]
MQVGCYIVTVDIFPKMSQNWLIKLEENPSTSYLSITSVIINILDNIVKQPLNENYRRIRLSDDHVANTLLTGIGAMECLFELGFVEGDDCLVLPVDTDLVKLKGLRNEIAQRRNWYLQKNTDNDISSQGSTKVRLNRQVLFYYCESVLQYEDPDIQKMARECIPVESLEIAAERKMRDIQLHLKLEQSKEEVYIQELLLMELVSWFKNSFFSWINPKCAQCCGPVNMLKTVVTDSHRTELYACEGCNGFTTPFHRYNDVRKLLETRTGRCGEWASCFTLMCRTLGYDARLVLDVTDHLWTEVYLLSSNPRWVHVDPCEGVIDAPLMYECGWKKKLSFILSFSVEGVQDVTWRYTLLSPKDLRNRRKLSELSEEELLAAILAFRQKRYNGFSVAKQKYLIRRSVVELADFLWVPGKPQSQIKEDEKKGRASGSLAWRLARGEMGCNMELFKPHIWQLTENERDAKILTVKYSCALDKYVKLVGGNATEIEGWKNGLFEVNSVFRKKEDDWKMVYLARTEDAEQGSIKLKFDVSSSGLVVKSVSVHCQSAVFESGNVVCMLCGADICTKIPTGENTYVFKTTDLGGAQVFTLEAKLKGGNGETAWQHAQLFRQSLTDDAYFPLEIQIELKNV